MQECFKYTKTKFEIEDTNKSRYLSGGTLQDSAMNSTDFVQLHTRLMICYEDGWYSGIVQTEPVYHCDENGSYITCSVLYEQDGLHEETLYAKDFNNVKSDEAWKMANPVVNMLIEMYLDHDYEINNIKKITYKMHQVLKRKRSNTSVSSGMYYIIFALLAGMCAMLMHNNHLYNFNDVYQVIQQHIGYVY